MEKIANIYRLGVKELYSLLRDPVLMGLIFYTFTFAIYTVANGVQTELRNASIAIVDEDHTGLSNRIAGAFLPPYFKPPQVIGLDAVDAGMNAGLYTFVLDIPPGFEADVLGGRQPVIQLNVDATAMTIAGNGATYISSIINAELLKFVSRSTGVAALPVDLRVRVKFNPNLDSSWFMAVMQIINNLTILAIILSGAAVIREREHGTLEHLLVMPVTSGEIMLAKIWANGLVIVLAAVLSLQFVVQGLLDVPIAGSILLFAFGSAVYLFAVTAMGITLSTVATTMPQFGLLSIPVFVVMNLLSGGVTPLESMPEALQDVVQVLPSTHFIKFAQAVLYRGAGIDIVWPQLLTTAGIGAVFFAFGYSRFRATLAAVR
ncbi:MAG TPA: ABC transporter permease [Hyphomonas atlantica]|uniref:ABC transporter permease n=1 Tax=Hyphomonas atlantica TaxID=1280948 RepID=A0A356WAJ6_9PROT|nr:ABC transporter permease [Magnetovibrio sp.]MAY65642.1 ABC transporter permease [Rhodospirillaceae bacterium]HBQ50343.1 ABC transporter permease [Hyphomonas atlantica]